MARVFMAAYTNYRRDPRVKREAEALVAEGHDVTFLACRQHGEPLSEVIEGVRVRKARVRKAKCTSFLQYMVDYTRFFLILTTHLTLHARRYDLIHINNMPDFLVLAAWLPRLLGRPVIHDVHDLMPELYMEKFAAGPDHWVIRVLRAQERWAGRLANAVLTVEDRLKTILAERGIPVRKIHVLMNLPDDRIFAPRPLGGKAGDRDRFVMVYHGTLARRLGLDIAIEAVSLLKGRIPSLELRIIGAGEERDNLMALRDRLGLRQDVTFSEGFVPVERIPGMLQDADVGIIPLRACSGTDIMLPTKLLEYVSMGIPCVSPKTGTIARYFDDTMVCFFEAENSVSLAEALWGLYSDAGRRDALVRNANEKFNSRYAWREHKKVYTALVSDLLAASGG